MMIFCERCEVGTHFKRVILLATLRKLGEKRPPCTFLCNQCNVIQGNLQRSYVHSMLQKYDAKIV